MENADISNDTIIYHYMDITHLCAMLDSGTFYISQKVVFKDHYEQELLPQKQYFAFTPVGANIPSQNASSLQSDINKEREHYKAMSTTLTSCWALGPYENELMWRSYTKPCSGVCLQTTIGKFVESLITDSFEIYCGKIIYTKRGQCTKAIDAEWMKNPEYSGEREIRFYFKKTHLAPFPSYDDNNRVFVGVDYRKLLDKIILSPFMRINEINQWKRYLANSYAVEEKKIVKSAISLNP